MFIILPNSMIVRLSTMNASPGLIVFAVVFVVNLEFRASWLKYSLEHRFERVGFVCRLGCVSLWFDDDFLGYLLL